MGAELADSLQPGVIALGWTLIDSLWQGVLVAALYAAARATLVAPRARLFAGHMALLALAIAPPATFFSYMASSGPAPAMPAGAITALLVPQDSPAEPASAGWLAWVVAGWLAGVLLLGLRLLREWLRLKRLCAEAHPLDARWQGRFEALCAELKVRLRVRLLQGAQVATPMLVGVLRPVILLPAGLVMRMPADQLELVLVHELAHLRRLDPLFNLLQTVLDTLLFHHPAVHWISRRVRQDRELCCDEVVLRHGADRLNYARALLLLAESEARLDGMPALAASGGVLLERVERIVEQPSEVRSPARPMVALAMAAVVALLWWTQDQDRAGDGSIAPLATAALPTPASIALPALDLVISDIGARITAPRWQPPVVREQIDATGAVAAPLPREVQPLAEVEVQRVDPTAEPATLAMADPAPSPVAVDAPALHSAPAPSLPPLLQRIAPVYPRAARLAGIEGWVTLQYRIAPDGQVAGIEVIESWPEGTFDEAAREALARWRYQPGPAYASALNQRFDFVLPDDEVVARDFGNRCARRTGSRVCLPAHATLPSSTLSPD